MSVQTKTVTWHDYQAAWADVNDQERERLLELAVNENCIVKSPDSNFAGRQALAQRIHDFQRDHSGAYFETNKFQEHNDLSIAEWIMYSRDGAPLLSGATVAAYDENLHIIKLAGFWST